MSSGIQRRRLWNYYLALSTLATISLAADARRTKEIIAGGEQLFIKEFAVGQAGPNGGDGLGPLFNHVSCAACHRQGAIGGGGGIEFNVSLLSAQLTPNASRPDPKLLAVTLKGLHPAFVGDDDRLVPNILLHRFGPGERYFQLKTSIGGQFVPLDPNRSERNELQKRLSEQPLPSVTKANHVRLIRAQRNTTALFGAGLIDKISDNVLHELAKLQEFDGKVSGRVPPIGPDKVGRFGWRGQQEHLHDFVLGACANELGLEVPRNSQPMDPTRPKYRPVGLDLSDEQCQSLTTFIAALPKPREFKPRQAHLQAHQNRGRDLFESVGCIHCHVADVGSVAGIYSDLLLHDMGPSLADPVMAEPSLVFVRPLPPDPSGGRPQPQPVSPGMYYGGSTFQDLVVTGPRPTSVEVKDAKTGDRNLYKVVASNLESEWRTPPLWGVGDSAPYLHDGRAATLLDAINLHEGEADFSVKEFHSLDLADRMHLINFLQSLQAP